MTGETWLFRNDYEDVRVHGTIQSHQYSVNQLELKMSFFFSLFSWNVYFRIFSKTLSLRKDLGSVRSIFTLFLFNLNIYLILEPLFLFEGTFPLLFSLYSREDRDKNQ